MRTDLVASEIEKLKARKIDLSNRINLTRDSDEKEELRSQIERIQKQIETLEKFYTRK